MKVDEFFSEKFIPARKYHSSLKADVSRYENHIGPVIGHMKIELLKDHVVMKVMSVALGSDVSPATLNRIYSLLQAIFRHARMLGYSKVELHMKRFKEKQKTVYLTREEIGEMLSHPSLIHPTLEYFLVLAAFTGGRAGELMAFDPVDDIDWEHDLLILRHTKSGKQRSIPMHKQLKDFLTEKWGEFPVIKRYHTTTLLRKWGIYCLGKQVTAHQLRHSFATCLSQGGIDIPTIASYLGHSNVAMTMRYAHPKPLSKAAVTSLGV